MTHPKHEIARLEMAHRLAQHLYNNHCGSDFVALAGDRFWSDFVVKSASEKHNPSPATRALTIEALRDLEASGAPRGPSLEEIAGERGDADRHSSSPDTTSDGAPIPMGSALPPAPSEISGGPFANPGQQDATTRSLPPSVSAGPSDPSEAPAAHPPVGHSREDFSSSPAASDDARHRTQGSLPSGPVAQASLPFQSHSETSRKAAHDPVTKDVAAAHRILVAQTLRELGPLTDDQIADHLGLTTEQVRIRRIGLMHEGQVKPAGRGLSRKGRPCNTWDLVYLKLVVSA